MPCFFVRESPRSGPWGEVEGKFGTPISPPQAIQMMTINGAWAMELEDVTGTIQVGKSADMIVLDRNLFQIPPKQIHDTTVLTTVFRGEPVQIEDSVRAYLKQHQDDRYPTRFSFP